MFWSSGMRLLTALAALMLCVMVVRADENADAGMLLEQANAAYLAAVSSSGSDRVHLMREVRTTLDRIVDEYPSSDLAVQIVLSEPVGLIDVSEVDAALAAAPPDPSDYRPIRDPAAAQQAEASLELDTGRRREIQRRLSLIGFNTRGVDGVFGPDTRAAIGAWQSRSGWPATGYIDEFQLGAIVFESDPAFAKWQAEVVELGGQPGDDRSRRRRTGRYIGSDGCLREPSGTLVPYYSFKCDLKGALRLD